MTRATSVRCTPRAGSILADPDVVVRYRQEGTCASVILPPRAVDVASDRARRLASSPRAVRASALPAEVWEASDGRWYRRGGSVYFYPGDDGGRFVIFVRRGATVDDFAFLEDVVSRARGGAFHGSGWEPHTDRDGVACWAYLYSRPYLSAESGRSIARVHDQSPKIIACTDTRCVKQIHLAGGDAHVLAVAQAPKHTVRGEQYVDRDGAEGTYTVTVTCAENLTAQEAAALAVDLLRIQALVRDANAENRTPAATS